MEWQPIETAPKDGTEILALYPVTVHGVRKADYSIVRWERTHNSIHRWVAQADGQRAIESQGDTWTDYIEPFVTHWMPLPEPPSEKG